MINNEGKIIKKFRIKIPSYTQVHLRERKQVRFSLDFLSIFGNSDKEGQQTTKRNFFFIILIYLVAFLLSEKQCRPAK